MPTTRADCRLVERTGAQVLGPALEKMPVRPKRLQQGDRLDWHGLSFDIHEVPGHTLGHIGFLGPACKTKPPSFLWRHLVFGRLRSLV
jgi:hydroxyacylglutathione hydrolase